MAATVPAVDPTATHSRSYRAAARFARSRVGRRLAIDVSSRLDPVLLRLSGGRLSTFPMAKTVLLTVPGRRSGVPRTCPLLYFTQGDEVVLIASSFGRAKHPAWYHNVTANPEVELLSRGRGGRYVARQTEGEERARLYALAQELYSGYGPYQDRAGDREIPVLALRPVA